MKVSMCCWNVKFFKEVNNELKIIPLLMLLAWALACVCLKVKCSNKTLGVVVT